MERRLAAILAADVVGYSRLMNADEAGTLRRLTELRETVLVPLVSEHHGRIVKLIGDGLLVEFASAVDSVACALAWQERVANHESQRQSEAALRFRIGINLGDVIAEDGDIHGDGVNIAARLEGLADPGGICLSDDVYRQARGRIEARFEDVGEHKLKNISEPVHVYRVVVSNVPAAETEPLPLPDKPSIAVLPFDSMSGDPEQEYFSDGMTEDIITELSRIRWLFVIARNSSFAYKGKSPDVRRAAAELGVRYILEGSVRKGGDRVRITAQLIDATDGTHVWAERFDRDIGDVFALQDEITATLIAAIEPELAKAEQQRAIKKPVESLDAWSWFQRGLWHHNRATREDNEQALVYIGKAIELDPEFSRALATLAHVHYWMVLFGYTQDAKSDLRTGLALARRAITADEREPYAHFALGRISTLLGDLDTAVEELELAIELSPSFAHAYYGLGNALNFIGRAEDAIEKIDRAIRLNPHDPAIWTFMSGRAWSLFFLGRYDEAHPWALKGVRQANAGWLSHAIAACVFAELGQREDASASVAAALELKPDFRTSFISDNDPFRNRDYLDRFTSALRKAGIAE